MPSTEADAGRSFFPDVWLVPPMALIVVAGIIPLAIRPVNGDASWYLYMAGRVLDGARLYVDVVDTNPPLIVGLSLGVVLPARLVGISPLRLFPALICVLIAGSLALAWRLARGLPGGMRQAGSLALAYGLLAGVGPAFGQREHLLVILIVPYALGAAAEARGDRPPRGLALLSGVLAGVGFGLKPFFLPAVAAVEVWLGARRGPRAWTRPQAIGLVATLFAYALLLLTWTPEYLDLARRIAPIYPHHDPLGPKLIASSWRLGIVATALGLGWFGSRARVPGWGQVFGLLALWLTAAVYLTGKGWDYHWYPAESLSIVLLSAGGAGAIRARPTPARSLAAAMGLVTLCAAGGLFDRLGTRRPDDPVRRIARERAGGGGSLLVLSPWLHKSFPMVLEADARWGMRHPMLWQVAAFYDGESIRAGRYHQLAAMGEPERRFVGEVAADFASSRPDVLLVDDDPPTPALLGFDYLAYFSRDPRFAEALGDYESLGRSNEFRVWVRRGGPQSRAVVSGKPLIRLKF